mmetsp:Transcript_62234/g.110660  ORF Transcript_62234/g.110660 Transcript_62234/m.110660 type:complete len:698 (-) Transcript_62234:195-2288(-)
MASKLALLVSLLGYTLPAVGADSHTDCKKMDLDFIVLEGDPLMAEIEDDIRQDLSVVGINVNTRFLEKADFNKAMQQGDFSLCFTESWGPPYDPQSFATGWFRPDNEAHYPAMQEMEPPMTMQKMEELVTDVLSEENLIVRQEKWTNILQEMHRQAISNPMWSRSVPAIWNRRLSFYQTGPQQYDYPMHTFSAMEGSKTITVAPGAQTGLFTATGPMDPHSYRPNEFFISNWIYEGLVSYGHNGVILPSLATAWTIAKTQDGGVQYRFTLREGVTFHDGTSFNCAAAKMTFDHVLHPPLNHNWYHGWYHLALHTVGWHCDGEVFVVDLDAPYYPFLQELSLIRPLRMLSPEGFIDGPGTDKTTQNSCPTKWNNDDGFLGPPPGFQPEVKCAGIRSPIGTGPWKYDGTKYYDNDEAKGIQEVHFIKNEDWWGNSGRGNVEKMIIKHYTDSDAINAALLDNTLDVAVGDKVLKPQQVQQFEREHTATHSFENGPPLLNQIVVINAARAPTNNIEVRKLIMHSIDKARIVTEELYGQAKVADSLFPKDAPYCNIDLTPRWDYDLQKAQLMNCQPDLEEEIAKEKEKAAADIAKLEAERAAEVAKVKEENEARLEAAQAEAAKAEAEAAKAKADAEAADSNDDLPLAVGLTVGGSVLLVLAIGVACFLFGKKKGYATLEQEQKDQKKLELSEPVTMGSAEI